MFSGPHEKPFVCAPQQSTLTQLNNAWFAGLPVLPAAPPIDANCSISAPRRLSLPHQRNTSALAQWPAGATAYPADHGARPPPRRKCRTSCESRPARSTARSIRPRCCTTRSTESGAGLAQPAGELERQADLHLRRRLHRRLVPPGRLHRWRDRRLHAAQRLRARVLVAERLRQQLQRPDRGRDDDDGEGALHRGVRPAGAHARLGLLGRLVRAAPDRATTTRACSTASSRAARSPRSASPRSTSSPTPGCSTTTSPRARRPWAGATSRSARSPASWCTTRRRTSTSARAASTRGPASVRAARRCRSVQRYDPVTNPTGVRCTVLRPHGQRLRPRPDRPALRAGRSTTSASSTA